MSSTKRVLAEFYLLLLLLFLSVAFFVVEVNGSRKLPIHEKGSRKSVSTVLVFGDSTVDPGNNNFISTLFKGNFPPYGRDFDMHIPTGRFSNGRLPTDYIAEYLGIKDSVPPYLDPTLSTEELISGVSFASAGSGFDPLTPRISNVIPLGKQLDYFKDYKARLIATIGEEKTENLVNKALFLVSAGTNDFVVNYFTLPLRRKEYDISSYIDFCLQKAHHFLQGLMELGARRIGVAGLPPMGCLPIVITLFSDAALTHRNCITSFSSVAQIFNSKLQLLLNSTLYKSMEEPIDSLIGYLDIYGPILDMALQSQKYEFEEVNSGCCGTGLIEASFLCNPKSLVCQDASQYLFFDSIHPSEKSYYFLSQALRPTIDSFI